MDYKLICFVTEGLQGSIFILLFHWTVQTARQQFDKQNNTELP